MNLDRQTLVKENGPIFKREIDAKICMEIELIGMEIELIGTPITANFGGCGVPRVNSKALRRCLWLPRSVAWCTSHHDI